MDFGDQRAQGIAAQRIDRSFQQCPCLRYYAKNEISRFGAQFGPPICLQHPLPLCRARGTEPQYGLIRLRHCGDERESKACGCGHILCFRRIKFVQMTMDKATR